MSAPVKKGDQLWLILYSNQGRALGEEAVKVVRVGRKYAYFLRWGREIGFVIDTLQILPNNGQARGSLVRDLEAWKYRRLVESAQSRLRNELREILYRFPEGMSLGQVLQVAELLGIPAEKIKPPPHV